MRKLLKLWGKATVCAFLLFLLLLLLGGFCAAATTTETRTRKATTTHSNNHAILVDASRFWFNYRHAANTLAIYKTIKRLGIPDENIILMVADDYACNSRNVRAGEVFTDDSGYENNVYTEDIEVDYRGDEVTPANVLRVLLDAHYFSGGGGGDETEAESDNGLLLNLPNSKRLRTDENSNVLFYLTGHGGDEFLKFQDQKEITSMDLQNAFAKMREMKRYNELLFVVDTCQAGTMFKRFNGLRGLDALLENTTIAEELKSRLSTEAWKFAERHRGVINALLRRSPQLLTTSLKTLLRTPALVDFDVKRAHIQLKLKKEKEKYVSRGTSKLKIRRSHLLEDSYNQLRSRTHEEMKGRMQITFAGEEGIDAGGLTREWYQILAREIFNPDWGLFQLAPSGEACYEPNKHSSINPEHLSYFRFVGRLIGKALYDGVLLDAYFTRPIYKHLLGQPLTFEDMEGVDPDYYKNLKWMLDNDIEGVLDLNFSDTQNFFGETKTVDLIKNGRNVSVTNVNKLDYVNLITAHRMTDAVKDQLEAFIEGFTKVVDRDIIGVLNASELELLISGTPDIDLDDLKANTEYHGGYTPTSPQIRWFWEIVREMNLEDRARLLMFCTGTSKVPLEGFEKLRGMSGLQKFQIHKAQANDPNQLCTAHTCFNQLDLIAYDTKEELKERLLYSIREGSQGFGFA